MNCFEYGISLDGTKVEEDMWVQYRNAGLLSTRIQALVAFWVCKDCI
jgi:uncharacterized protein (DUF427 family)